MLEDGYSVVVCVDYWKVLFAGLLEYKDWNIAVGSTKMIS